MAAPASFTEVKTSEGETRRRVCSGQPLWASEGEMERTQIEVLERKSWTSICPLRPGVIQSVDRPRTHNDNIE